MRTNLFRCALVLIFGAWIGGAAPATRPSAEAQPTSKPIAIPTVLHFNERSIRGILAGTKTVSVRKGTRTISDDGIRAVGSEGTTVMLKVIEATQKKLSDLSADDAKGNGSDSVEDLQAEMARNYPGIKVDDVVTVIKFKLN